MEGTAIPPSFSPTAVTLNFKRDRKIRNKAELSRLERQFITYADEVQKLEREKSFVASVAAYVIGVIGAGFTAGFVSAREVQFQKDLCCPHRWFEFPICRRQRNCVSLLI